MKTNLLMKKEIDFKNTKKEEITEEFIREYYDVENCRIDSKKRKNFEFSEENVSLETFELWLNQTKEEIKNKYPNGIITCGLTWATFEIEVNYTEKEKEEDTIKRLISSIKKKITNYYKNERKEKEKKEKEERQKAFEEQKEKELYEKLKAKFEG